MLNLDPGKLLVIAVVAVILLGPDKLPQVGRQVGGAWRSFNEFRHRMETEVRGSIPDLPSTGEIARLARSPSALLNHLSNMGTDDENTPPPGTAENPLPGPASGPGFSNESKAGSGAGSAPTPASNGHSAQTPTTAPSPHTEPMPQPTATSTSTPANVPTPARPPDVIVTGDPSLN
jgi:sec-independent protein translocase protein TatB